MVKMDTLQTAQWWKQLGISTIPVVYGSKQPRVRWLPYTERLPEDHEIRKWYSAESNIAIVTGWNNLVILDFDDADKLNAWRSWADDELRIRHNAAPSTVYRNTRIHHSARGYHVFVFCDDTENMKLPKLDVLADRKYALIPPSLHPSGVNYEVYQGGIPMRINSLYDVLPKKLLDAAYAAKAPKSVQPASTIPSGPDPLLVPDDADMWTVMGTAYDDQPHAVAEIKKRWRIEQMFPGAIQSSGNGR